MKRTTLNGMKSAWFVRSLLLSSAWLVGCGSGLPEEGTRVGVDPAAQTESRPAAPGVADADQTALAAAEKPAVGEPSAIDPGV